MKHNPADPPPTINPKRQGAVKTPNTNQNTYPKKSFLEKLSFFSNSIIAVCTIVTAFIVYFQYDVSIKNIQETKKLIDSTAIANFKRDTASDRISRERFEASIKLSKQIADSNYMATQKELRPYLVFIEPKITTFEVGKKIAFNVSVENVGKTPAYNAHAYIRIRDEPSNKFMTAKTFLMEMDSFAKTGVRNTFSANQNFDMSDSTSVILNDYIFALLNGGQRNLYFWGNAIYEDGFGMNHFTHFCGKYNLASKKLLVEGKYNDAN